MASSEENANPYESPLGESESDADKWKRRRLFWQTAFFACILIFAIFFEGVFALRQLLSLTFAGVCAIGWALSLAFSPSPESIEGSTALEKLSK